jgi:hypothetical protein
MSDSSDIAIGLATANAGTATVTVTLDFASGLPGAETVLPSQSVTLTGTVYREAAPAVVALPINFIVHVGDAAPSLMIGNAAANDGFSEGLIGSVIATTGAITAASTSEAISPGSTGSPIPLVTTSLPGIVSGSITLDFESDGTSVDGFGPTDIGQQTLSVSGVVNNYADPSFKKVSGPGTLTQSGNDYTLDLGTIAATSSLSVNLEALNDTTGPSDLLAGNFTIDGASAFTNSGSDGFSGLGAGQADTSPVVSLDTSEAGTYSETITLHSSGTNASGCSGALPDRTLTIIADVVFAQAQATIDTRQCPRWWESGYEPEHHQQCTISCGRPRRLRQRYEWGCRGERDDY